MKSSDVKAALQERANPEKAAFFPRFFKSGPGQYGEGDKFVGVIVPDQRKIARKFRELPSGEIVKLLKSKWHEHRLTALLILVSQFERSKTDAARQKIYETYMANLKYVNNWDLVDSSCHKIIGPWLFERSRKPLYKLAASKDLWKNRIAMVTTYYFLKRGDFGDVTALAEKLLHHPHDLIHKAVGWMLREAGNQNKTILVSFLDQYANVMPRTMLRYSLEKLDAPTKKKYMAAAATSPATATKRTVRKHK